MLPRKREAGETLVSNCPRKYNAILVESLKGSLEVLE